MKPYVRIEENAISFFYDHDFCKRLEVLLQHCVELNPLFNVNSTYKLVASLNLVVKQKRQTIESRKIDDIE
jgi:hypothetical protein